MLLIPPCFIVRMGFSVCTGLPPNVALFTKVKMRPENLFPLWGSSMPLANITILPQSPCYSCPMNSFSYLSWGSLQFFGSLSSHSQQTLIFGRYPPLTRVAVGPNCSQLYLRDLHQIFPRFPLGDQLVCKQVNQ